MSWLLKQQQDKYKIWSSITDSDLTPEWLSKDDLLKFIFLNKLDSFVYRFARETVEFPGYWTDKETGKYIPPTQESKDEFFAMNQREVYATFLAKLESMGVRFEAESEADSVNFGTKKKPTTRNTKYTTAQATGKRSGIDFSKHSHRKETFASNEGGEITVDHLQIKSDNQSAIRFTNTSRILVVDGDYGNWVFCRQFAPSAEGEVIDHYWIEKLKTDSLQTAGEYDPEETRNEIQQLIDSGLSEYGYEDKELVQAIEWFTHLQSCGDDELEYTYTAYRTNAPDFLDTDLIPFCKKLDEGLEVVFDGFEEICRRLKETVK